MAYVLGSGAVQVVINDTGQNNGLEFAHISLCFMRRLRFIDGKIIFL